MNNTISTALTAAALAVNPGCAHLHYDNGNPHQFPTYQAEADTLRTAAEALNIPEAIVLAAQLRDLDLEIGRQLSAHHLQRWMASVNEQCDSAWFDLAVPTDELETLDCRSKTAGEQIVVDSETAYSVRVFDADFDCLNRAIGDARVPISVTTEGVEYGAFPGLCSTVMMPVNDSEYVFTSSCDAYSDTDHLVGIAIESHGSYCR